MEVFIVFIVLAVVCVVAFFYWIFTKKIHLQLTGKPKKQKVKKVKPVKQEKIEIKNFNLALVDKFMYRKELLFWKYLNSILPRTFIALPKVAFSAIINPDGDKNLYNEFIDRNLDIVVFDEQNMKPVLVIDIYDNTFNDDKIEEADPKLFMVLEKLELKVISILMKTDFDKEAAKKLIYDQLNIKTAEKTEDKQ